MKPQKVSWIKRHSTAFTLLTLLVCGIVVWYAVSPSMQTVLQQVEQTRIAEKNADLTSVTSLINSCSYDIWHNISNVYLNNGLHLTYEGNLNLEVGGSYTITYHSKSNEMESWTLNP